MASLVAQGNGALGRWAEKLKNSTITALTRDYPETTQNNQSATQRPIEATQNLEILPETQEILEKLQKENLNASSSYFTVLLTALVILTNRLTGDEDILLGTGGDEGKHFVLRQSIDPKTTFSELLKTVEKV
jgi:L-aminoadipate-semialdehyde dehydrogenase